MSVPNNSRDGGDFLGYRIEALLGHGGMGVVYRAYDLRLKRRVALKFIAPEFALDDRFRERFLRESELALSLEHPNVVPIYDAGEVDGHLYLAMRYVEGSDLKDLLREEGALDPARALAIAEQVAQALDAAHTSGLVHRDVKPSNVLLDASAHVYLADFGLTRRLDEQGFQPGAGRSVGTPAYLAPEQIEGKVIDGRADVYSLGCLLYECLTGEAPFPRDSRLGVAWAHLEEEPPSATGRNAALPEALDPVIRTAMAKDREDRYQTATALIWAAEEALGYRKPSILRRRPFQVALGTVLVALLAATLIAVFVSHDSDKAAASTPVVRANTLVRIDPETNIISAVIDVAPRPTNVAAGGRSVWVYSREAATVTEIDAVTKTVRRTTKVPEDVGSGHLAADAGGAWLLRREFVPRERRQRIPPDILTRIVSGGGPRRDYAFDPNGAAVSVGEGAVWVLRRGDQVSQVLRIDPATGAVTAKTRVRRDSDGLAVGAGAVWAVSSPTANLTRIDARSAAVTGQTDLGDYAAAPVVTSGRVWVPVSNDGGLTMLVDPQTLRVRSYLRCCPLGQIGYAAGSGSVWGYDWTTGTVFRIDAESRQIETTTVTRSPLWGGLCITSIAAGATGIWVTVAPPLRAPAAPGSIGAVRSASCGLVTP